MRLFLVSVFLACCLFADTVPVRWTCVGPGGGGWIQSIACSRHDPNVLYVGGDVGGFYRSRNGGASYEISNAGLNNPWVEWIAEHPSNPKIILLASQGGIYRSTDGGDSWTEIRNGLPKVERYSFSVQISKIVFHPSLPDCVFATVGQPRTGRGGQGAIYRSDDCGLSWRQIVRSGLPKNANIFDIAIHPQSSGRILISTDVGLFLSLDTGETWKPSNTGIPAHLRTRHLAQSPTAPDVVYVSLRAKGGETPWQAGVYRSDDAGATWNPCNNGFQQKSGKAGMDDMYTTWVDRLAVHPSNPNLVYAGGASWWESGVYRTDDGGKNWRQLLPPERLGWIAFWGPTATCLSLSSVSPDTVVFGTSGYVYRTEDGGKTWSQRYTQPRDDGKIAGTGLEVTCLHTIVPDPATRGRFYCGYYDIGLLRTDDGGKTFRRCMKGIPKHVSNSCFSLLIDPKDARHLIGAFGNWGGNNTGVIAESRDGGENWTPLANEESGWPGSRGRCLSRTRSGDGAFVLACVAEGHGVFTRADGDTRWKPCNEGLPAERVTAFGVDAGTLYAGTKPSQSECGAIYRRALGDAKWERITTEKLGEVYSFAAHDGFVVAGIRSGYQKALGVLTGGVWTRDKDKDWRNAFSGNFCQTVLLDPSNPKRILVGWTDHPYHDRCMGEGVFESLDGGATWRSLNSPSLMLRNISCLALDPFDRKTVWVGTGGNSIFVGSL